MAKSSISVGEVLNSTGRAPQEEVKGLRLTIKPTRFMASVKKDGTFKTISLNYQTIDITTPEQVAAYGFPLGARIAINAYLSVKKASKAQLTQGVLNYRAAQEAKKNAASNAQAGVMNIDDVDTDEGDDE